MADSFLTLADLTKVNDQNIADLDIRDLLDEAPLLATLSADTASNGTDHKYLKETGAPTVGFRAVNAGRDNSNSTDTLVSMELKILAASFFVDKALADAYVKGGPSAYVAREARRHLRAAFYMAEQQFIYGTDNEADGFNGLVDDANLDGLADEMVVGAGGSSARTSVWAIRTNDMGTDVQVITGNDGNIMIGDSVVQQVEDGTGKHYPAYYTPIEGWLGLQVGGKYSVGRLANVAANALDDDLIADLINLFPANKPPNYIVMNRRSRGDLRKSRTATNSTGQPAPFPTEVHGIPIVTTDAITNAETAVA